MCKGPEEPECAKVLMNQCGWRGKAGAELNKRLQSPKVPDQAGPPRLAPSGHWVCMKTSQAIGDPQFPYVLYLKIDLAKMDPGRDTRILFYHLPLQQSPVSQLTRKGLPPTQPDSYHFTGLHCSEA